MLMFMAGVSVLSISMVFFGGVLIGNGNAQGAGVLLTALGSGVLGTCYAGLINIAGGTNGKVS